MGYVFSRSGNGVKVTHTNGSTFVIKEVLSIQTNGSSGIIINTGDRQMDLTIDSISSIDTINGVAALGTLSGVIEQLDSLFNQNVIKTVSDEFTRPADIIAYAVKDVVGDGTVRSLTIGSINGQSGKITKARLMSSDKALAGLFRVHLYTVAPTAIADNAPNTLLYANKASHVGVLDFSAMSSEDAASTASFSVLSGLTLGYNLNAADTKLYYVLETLTAFTPVASTTFYIELDSTLPS